MLQRRDKRVVLYAPPEWRVEYGYYMSAESFYVRACRPPYDVSVEYVVSNAHYTLNVYKHHTYTTWPVHIEPTAEGWIRLCREMSALLYGLASDPLV